MKKKAKKESNNKSFNLMSQINKGIMIGLIIGIFFSILVLKTSSSIVEREIKTSCDININSLYEKSCTAHEDCYGRLELCSASLHKCVTTVQIDRTDLRNIRIPDTRQECEANGGTWNIEVVETSKN